MATTATIMWLVLSVAVWSLTRLLFADATLEKTAAVTLPAAVLASGFNRRGRASLITDRFGNRERYLVKVKVLQGGVPTGEDEGVIWFDRGLLNFKGFSVSFALGNDSLAPSELRTCGRGRFAHYAVGLVHQGRETTLKIGNVKGYHPRRSHQPRNNLESALQAWLAADPAQEFEVVLPPAAIDPRLLSAAPKEAGAALVIALSLFFFLVSLDLAISGASKWPHPWGPVSISGGLLGACVVAFSLGAASRRRRYRLLFPDDPLFVPRAG